MSIHIHLARTKKQFFKMAYYIYDVLMGTDTYIQYSYKMNGYNNPDYRFTKSEICLLHIPKTAGTSFSKMLKNHASNHFVNLDIHRPVSKFCPSSEFKYVTILREPIARVWSYYQMVLRSPKGYPYKKYAVLGLRKFIEKCPFARNLACKYISGNADKMPDFNTLQTAIDNLNNFYAVLSFDNFTSDASLFLKQHKISFDHIPNERKSKYSGPSIEEAELIRKHNQLDIDLFENWVNSHDIKS